jgi:hypothetical protein
MKPWLLILLLPVAALASETFTDATVDAHGLGAEFRKFAPQARAALQPQDRTYAVVRRAALTEVNAMSLYKLTRHYGIGGSRTLGTSGWEKRFNCEDFLLGFIVELRSRMHREFFHSRSAATRPACQYVGFVQDENGRGHAILFIVTDTGPVWWDPVAGEVTLSETEVRSIFLPRI